MQVTTLPEIAAWQQQTFTYKPVTPEEYEESYKGTGIPIIIDFGGYQVRGGYLTDEMPRICVAARTGKARHRKDAMTLAGHYLMRVDQERLNYRSPSERGQLTNLDDCRDLLDYLFESLGLEGQDRVDHPIIFTETVCAYNFPRHKLTELFFMVYRVPSLCIGIDFLFSFHYHKATQKVPEDGMIICSSHEVTHMMPILNGRPDFQDTIRLDVGGHTAVSWVVNSLKAQYPQHREIINADLATALMHQHCIMVDDDYMWKLSQLASFTNNQFHFQPGKLDTKADPTGLSSLQPVVLQLPFVKHEVYVESEAELAEKAKKRDAFMAKMRKVAREKAAAKLQEKRNQLTSYEALIEQRERKELTHLQYIKAITKGGFDDEEQFLSIMKELKRKIEKADQNNEGVEVVEEKFVPFDERVAAKKASTYPLVDVPDEGLSEEQVIQKRRQTSMFRLWRGREKLKADKERLAEEERHNAKLFEEERQKNPQRYINRLHAERNELLKLRSERKAAEADDGGSSQSRVSTQKRKRQKLALEAMKSQETIKTNRTASGKRNSRKEEAGYGDDDADWDIYRQLAGDDSDDDRSEEEKEQIEALDELLRKYDPGYAEREKKEEEKRRLERTEQVCQDMIQGIPVRYATMELEERVLNDPRSQQIHFYLDRVRAPEVLWQPMAFIGLQQAGLGECLERLFKRKTVEEQAKMAANMYICGGNAKFPNFVSRLVNEVTAFRPTHAPLHVTLAEDPVLDAWRGARLFAKTHFEAKTLVSISLTVEEYLGSPVGMLKQHECSNEFFPTPDLPDDFLRDRKRRRR